MWIIILILLLVAAHLNLTGLVPLQPGDPLPPWWVGGRLAWPFAVETRTLIPPGDLLNALTPILSIISAAFFLAAASALLRWYVPVQWFPWLIVAGAAASFVLQGIWLTGWAAFPLLLNVLLLWAVFGQNLTAATLRG
jgi:hypothetical protein